MQIREITLFKTPMEINGENRFFPDEENSLNLMKNTYLNFLKNSFEYHIVKPDSIKGVNVADMFTITLPLNFIGGHEYNYACILTNDSIVSNNQFMFYFIKASRENNAMENMQYTFYLDYLIQYSKEIYRHKNRQVLKERSHIPYIEYDSGANRIKNSSRVLNTYSKPTITELIPHNVDDFPYDILWYDVQVTRFKREIFTTQAQVPNPERYLEEYSGNQDYCDGFSSTYHLFRPYKVYYKGTKNEVDGVIFRYRNEYNNAGVMGWREDTIQELREIQFRETTSNIVNIELTFNVPFHYFKYGEGETPSIVVRALGSAIADIDDEYITDKHFMYEGINEDFEYRNYTIFLDSLYNLSIPSQIHRLQSKTQLIDNSPLLRYANLYGFNLIFNNSVIPLYTEKYTSILKVSVKEYPKDEGAFVELIIRDEDNNIIFNSENLPVIFNRIGTIPYTVDQYQSYKIANGSRIKANIIGNIAGGVVTLGSIAVGGSLGGIPPLARPMRGEINPNLLTAPAESLDMGASSFEIVEQSQSFSANGARATRIMNELATFADLKDLVTLAGQSAQNSMTDLIYQDRLLISQTKPIDKYCESMFSFCKEYQDYGAVINREDEFLSLYSTLESFMYIKTVDLQLPISSAHNSAINGIFNRGVRLWHCVGNVQPIAEFNTMISNYER